MFSIVCCQNNKIFFSFLCMFRFPLDLDSRLAPKGKDRASIHAVVIEGKMYCQCCKTGINRFKQQLAVVRENITPWEVDLEFIGEIMFELQQQFDEFEQKAKQKEMYDH